MYWSPSHLGGVNAPKLVDSPSHCAVMHVGRLKSRLGRVTPLVEKPSIAERLEKGYYAIFTIPLIDYCAFTELEVDETELHSVTPLATKRDVTCSVLVALVVAGRPPKKAHWDSTTLCHSKIFRSPLT